MNTSRAGHKRADLARMPLYQQLVAARERASSDDPAVILAQVPADYRRDARVGIRTVVAALALWDRSA